MKNILTPDEMKAVAALIAEKERNTTGELRVAIRRRRHLGERKLGIHQLAIKEFHQLGMHRTKHRIGILIFFLLSEHKFHIVADEGINGRVEEGTWDRVAENMSASFREQKFFAGLCAALNQVGDILSKHFPDDGGTKNELPDDVVIN